MKVTRDKRPQSRGGRFGISWGGGVRLWWFAAVVLCGLAFLSGTAVGYLQAPPVPQLLEARRWAIGLVKGPPPALSELEAHVFTDPIVSNLVYPPITSIAGIKAANDRMFIDVSDFDSAYERLNITRAARVQVGNSLMLRVDFDLAGKQHQAYAYLINRHWQPSRHRAVASLIIPGTGVNQSTRMLEGADSGEAQTWLPAFSRPDSDLFLFIKPNEDALAFHDGQAKLSDDAIKNYHLNRGGSYAASYIVQSLAMTKYLRSLYPKIVIGGVSQGGAATLLNAIQSKPDVAVIASGYSAFIDAIEVSDLTQIVIPRVWRDNAPAALSAKLRKLPTRFLLTWGEEDTPVYRLDLEHSYTCRELSGVSNITCTSHHGGHHFPVDQVQAFLKEQLQGKQALRR